MKLDQHFLIDDEIAELAVSLLEIRPGDIVVEIGPGHGELTKFIPRCNLVLVEKDAGLAKELEKKIKNAKVINGEGIDSIKKLKFDCLISSVPYSISEPLVRELMLHEFRKAVLILPGRFVKQMGGNETSLSFLVNEFFNARKVEKIGREKFSPSPRVDSFLVEITRKNAGPFIKKIYMQLTRKTKNALVEAIADLKGLTKKEARGIAGQMGIGRRTMEKTVRMLSYHELKYIKDTTYKLLQKKAL